MTVAHGQGVMPWSCTACRIGKLLLVAGIAAAICYGNDRDVRLPHLEAMLPIGGKAGTEVEVTLWGDMLSNAEDVEFDCDDLSFELKKATAGKIEGTIRLAEQAAPGPHILRAKTKDGYTSALWFTVGQFDPVREQEPNESPDTAQAFSPPCEIYGSMVKEERDFYSFEAEKGERWVIEVRGIQYGSMVESYLYLRDEQGRELAFNDDRSGFDVNSMIDYTFDRAGTYRVEVDSFRGLRGWGFKKNNGYVLRVSQLPMIDHISPLGGQAGSRVTVHVTGTALNSVERVFLTPTRRGEHFTLTIPWTLAVEFADDDSTASDIPRITGEIVRKAPDVLEVEFDLPPRPAGTWSLFVEGKHGIADPKFFELSAAAEIEEVESNDRRDEAQALVLPDDLYVIVNGRLEERSVSELFQDKDFYALEARKGVPLRVYTNAYQLLAPEVDTVVSLFDVDGELLAESDDLTAGRGFYPGSADSNLYYIPERDERIIISVSDRVGRGGPGYDYRLHVKSEEPGFHLIVAPLFGLKSISVSNFTVERGGESDMVVSMIRMPPKSHSDDPAAAAQAPPPGAVMEGEVRVWVEGLPSGVTAEEHRFRADEIMEPGGDGATFMVPERLLKIQAGDTVPPGSYPFLVRGEVVGKERIKAVGRAMDVMGGITELYNFLHRPAPQTTLTVIEPGGLTVELDLKKDQVDVMQGGTSAVVIKNRLPIRTGQSPKVWLTNAPDGLRAQPGFDSEGNLQIDFRAAEDLPAESSKDVYLEVALGNRIVSTRPFTVQVFAKEEKP